jgi:thiol-disulfide isomerase/thioredoxin
LQLIVLRLTLGLTLGLTLAVALTLFGVGVATAPAGLKIAPLPGKSPGTSLQGPPLQGWMQAFEPYSPPRSAPATPFLSAGGRPIKLADLEGGMVLVNFWATWCGPCIRELPSLAKLQADLGGRDFNVLLVSIDRGGAGVYEPFLTERLGIKNLGSAGDARGELSRAIGMRGLPTSVLIDRHGRMVGKLVGAAEWDSAEAKRLIRYYMGRP